MVTKSVKVKFNGKEKSYNLAMTRSSLRKAEAIGFNLQKVEENPITQTTYMLVAALWGGGYKGSAESAIELADLIFDNTEDFTGFTQQLAEMCNDVFHIRG